MQIRKTVPKLHARAKIAPSTLDLEKRTVEVVWSTGAQVRRFDWWDGEYIEELDMSPESVRLDRLNAGAPVLAVHDNWSLDSVIGVVERAWIRDGKGHAQIRFSDREDVQPIIQDVASGILRNISVGYRVHEFERIQPENKDALPILRATDWEPMEISFVPVPADPGAQVRNEGELFDVVIKTGEDMKDQNINQHQEPDEGVRDAGKQQIQNPAPPDESTIDLEKVRAQAAEEAARKERERIEGIRNAARLAKLDDEFANDLIERGVSLQEAKEKIMEEWAKRVDQTATVTGERFSAGIDERDRLADAAAEWLMHRSGIKRSENLQGNPFAFRRLHEIARMCLERVGVKTDGMRDIEIVGRAFTQSTSDFPVILENTLHRTLLDAYRTAPDTWRRFCRIGSVSDFRDWKRLFPGTIGNLDDLTELDEFKSKPIPDAEAESIRASTKGNIINISRQAIINDDLDYFMRLSQMLGRAAARTIEASVYSLLNSNPIMRDGVALFHSNHGNLAASGSANSVASWDAARVAMAKQKDKDGNDYLDIRPAIWLGPVDQGGDARTINDAQYDPDTANKLQKPNKVRGLVRDIVDTPRLTGTAWYMFADPADAPVFEVVFLDGQQEPFLDNEEGFTVDGVRWKVRLDFGVGALDWRGAYKNPGA